MPFHWFAAPLAFAFEAASLSIILPLYVYPEASASAWNNANVAITAYPDVQWQVIINPNSGPDIASGYPTDETYIASIANMNSYPNVITLGYVDTNYSMRMYSDVTRDIDVYAGWASDTEADISIDGIFFDDVTNDSPHTYMENAAAYANTTMPSQDTPIVFNPCTQIAPSPLFDYCDTVIEFESPYSDYTKNGKDATGADVIASIPNDARAKSAFIVYSTPSGVDVTSMVQAIAAGGIEAVYFGADCCYHVLDGVLLKQLAAAVRAG
ncbi:hypothetical protein MMC21_004724 [Puttea exsequens]|nr:hypothetical protein [Puttea exsequens]